MKAIAILVFGLVVGFAIGHHYRPTPAERAAQRAESRQMALVMLGALQQQLARSP